MEVTVPSKTRFIVFWLSIAIAAGIFFLLDPFVPPLDPEQSVIAQASRAIEKEDYIEASNILLPAIRGNPRQADYRYLMAQTYVGYRDMPRAMEQYQAALNINAYHPATLRAIALYYVQSRQMSPAEDALARLTALCARGQNCAERNEVAAAIAKQKALAGIGGGK